MTDMYSESDAMNAILKLLPPHTNKYPYRSYVEFLSDLRTEATSFLEPKSDASQFVLFTELSVQTFTNSFEQPIRGIICNTIDFYCPDQEFLIIKMKGGVHEAAHRAISDLLIEKLTQMSLANRGLVGIGQKTQFTSSRGKEADFSYRPKRLPRGRSKQWPTLVAESGYSESSTLLDSNAQWWFSASRYDVKIVITIDIDRKQHEINFTLYECQNNGTYTQRLVTVLKSSNNPIAQVNNGPLVISFHRLFLRDPIENENDIVFTDDDMRDVAEHVWDEQF